MNYSISTAANTSATNSVPSLAEMAKIADEFKRKERELLRDESLMIEQMECPKCGRKPTVTGRGIGDKTYVMCPHIWEAIKKHVKPQEPRAAAPGGLAPIGFMPYGVRIEVLDDGPRRW
jgi:hypothetical protein